jgi:hypothetical protein
MNALRLAWLTLRLRSLARAGWVLAYETERRRLGLPL